jgi:hypothetical protein
MSLTDVDDDTGLPDDTDEIEPEIEYESWKVREMVSTLIYAYRVLFVYMHLLIWMDAFIDVYIYIYMYIYMYKCIYIYMYIYTYIFPQARLMRDAEIREYAALEKADLERRRLMTDDMRIAEDKRLGKYIHI